MPRYPLLALPEFATPAALAHYTARKFKTYGDFTELRSHTCQADPERSCRSWTTFDALVESPQAVNGALSMDDIRVLPLLRSAAVVKGLAFPLRVRNYFEAMMNRIGFKPLPAV